MNGIAINMASAPRVIQNPALRRRMTPRGASHRESRNGLSRMIVVPHSGHMPPIFSPRKLYSHCLQGRSASICSPLSAAEYFRYLLDMNCDTRTLRSGGR